ncbi:MAG TPA: glycosyltransferase [Kofleriaceae bacterium]|nr:glycosyltransferase [Kofleriaceae bacterium]
MHRTACDLHVHSAASRTNDEWYSRDFGCPESFATPHRQYELCKARGMSLVTLTDHDTIAGGLELIDRPDFFLSEEITARFPEDGCDIHILAWNITPAQHDRLQAARPSVYDVVDVLRRERIAHACAHPLFSPNSKLTVEALEKILVLFPIVEAVNGLMDRRLESYFGSLITGLDETSLDILARRHRLTRTGAGHRMVAGSDAHSERHVSSCFTSVEGTVDVRTFLDAVATGEAKAHGRSANLDVMSLTASRVAYGFLSGRKLETPGYRDPFIDLVDVVAGREVGTDHPTGIRDELVQSMLKGAARTAVPLGPHLDLDSPADVMTEIRRVHDGLIGHAFEQLGAGISDLDMYRVLGAIRDMAGAISTAVPFLFATNHFARQRQQASEVMAAWRASPRPPAQSCLAIFSDTVDHVDGVTSSLRRFVRRAQAEGRNVRIPFCGSRPTDASDEVYVPLASTTSHGTSVYAGMELHVPSPLGTIEWLWRHDITHVELATPGPMGIMGLLAARLLRLPVTASYHTEVPELLRHLSGSAVLHKAASALVAWFYRAVDRVFVFSESSRQRLIQLGVPGGQIEHVPVAIDPHEFSPIHVSPDVFRSFGVSAKPQRIVLTVGRLSREKNVHLIIEAIGKLQHLPQPPTLVIVGDGPERENLQSMCANRPYVVFLGLQQGETLKRLYATADAFAFASRIDTLGLAPMEAMASGVPVVVPADAAIAELVVHGISGYCYEFGTDGIVTAIADVLESPLRRAQLASNARQAMVDRWDQARQADVWRAMAGEQR